MSTEYDRLKVQYDAMKAKEEARLLVAPVQRGYEDGYRAGFDAALASKAAAPVLYVSPEQLEGHRDPDDDESGRYLPARKTAAGMFTQPLYARSPAAVAAEPDGLDFEPSEQFAIADMANIGHALMHALPEGYSYNDSPTEIVSDLQNNIADLEAELRGKAVAVREFVADYVADNWSTRPHALADIEAGIRKIDLAALAALPDAATAGEPQADAAEPKAYIQRHMSQEDGPQEELVFEKDDELEGGMYEYEPLYTHAQPAPQALGAPAGNAFEQMRARTLLAHLWRKYDAAGISMGRSHEAVVLEAVLALLGDPDPEDMALLDKDSGTFINEVRTYLSSKMAERLFGRAAATTGGQS